MDNSSFLFNEELHDKLSKGVNCLADAVSSTMGALGKNVIIEQRGETPRITKDGVSVAESIIFDNNYERLGADLIKEASRKTCDEVGDATTGSTVLARELYNAFNFHRKNINNSNEFIRGVNRAKRDIEEFIKKKSRTVETFNDLLNIATISANNDAVTGKIVADACTIAGKYGSIIIESNTKSNTEIETIDGFAISNGYASQSMVTNINTGESVLNNPIVYVSSQRLDRQDQVYNIIDFAAKNNRDLLFIADVIEHEALACIMNNIESGLLSIRICAIHATEYGEHRKRMIDDCAVLFGCEAHSVIKNDIVFGSAEKIIASKSRTTIIKPSYKKEEFNKVKEALINRLQTTEDQFEKAIIEKRLSRFGDGTVVIKVGARTEAEDGELRDRIDDAILSCRSAIDEGYLPGGGSALAHACYKLTGNSKKIKSQSESDGYFLTIASMLAPIRTISQNAGIDYDTKLSFAIGNTRFKYGYNVLTGKIEDMYKSGIIDSTKVIRCSMLNAIHVAITLFNTSCALLR